MYSLQIKRKFFLGLSNYHTEIQMNVFKLFNLFFFFGFYTTLYSQQELHSYMYSYNPLLYNASYAGSDNAVSANFNFSKQWINIEGSPMSFLLSGSSPVWEGLSLGLVSQYEKEGINTRERADIIMSYKIRTSEKTKVSFGLGGGIHHIAKDFTKLTDEKKTDAYYEEQPESESLFQCQAGVMFYSERFRVSLSAKGLLNNHDDECFGYKQRPHYYLCVYKKLCFSDDLSVDAEVVATAEENSPISVDIMPKVDWNEVSLGLLYRLDTYVGVNVRTFVSEKFLIGVAYVHSFNDMAKANSHSSMELMVGFRCSLEKKEWKW